MASKLTPATNMAQLAAANTTFAIHLYRAVQDGEGRKKPVLFPAQHITMTYVGARGDTAAQIAEVFRFNQIEGNLHQTFKDMNDMVYQAQESYILRVANKLYGKSGYHFVQTFLEDAIAYYDSTVEAVDMTSLPLQRQSRSTRKPKGRLPT